MGEDRKRVQRIFMALLMLVSQGGRLDVAGFLEGFLTPHECHNYDFSPVQRGIPLGLHLRFLGSLRRRGSWGFLSGVR